MRPTSYDQRRIDDEYCKDRMREAEIARLALEAKSSRAQHVVPYAVRAAYLAQTLHHALARFGTTLGRSLRAGRQDIRRVVYWVTHLPRHT